MRLTNGFGTVKVVMLKGEQGIQGETGPQGEQGIQGEPFEFEDFTPEQLAELRADVASVYYRKLEATYHTIGDDTTSIEIPIEGYTDHDMLFVDVEGLALTEGVDYTISGSSIVLAEPITHNWTAVNFRALRAIAITAEDYDALKGEKGDKGDSSDVTEEYVQNAIADEATIRSGADTALGERIDAFVAITNSAIDEIMES